MNLYHTQASLRANPNPQQQTRTYFSTPPGKIDTTTISQHHSQAAKMNTSAQHPTRLKFSANNPRKNLWAWDDFSRGNSNPNGHSTAKRFVCYLCQGYPNPDRSCCRCGAGNSQMFGWLGSQDGEYEEMRENENTDEDVVAYKQDQARPKDKALEGIAILGLKSGSMECENCVYGDEGRERTAVEFIFDDLEEGECPVVNLPKPSPGMAKRSCLKSNSERIGYRAYTEALNHLMQGQIYNAGYVMRC